MKKQYFVHNIPGLWFVDFRNNYKKFTVVKTGEKSPALSKAQTNMMLTKTYDDALKYYNALKIACIKHGKSFDTAVIEEFDIVPYYRHQRGFGTRRKLIMTYYKI